MGKKASTSPRLWAILPSALDGMRRPVAYDDDDECDSSNHAPSVANQSGVAVIELAGPMTKRGGSRWMRVVSMLAAEAALRAAAKNPAVSAIVLALDSPGGTVDGTERLGAAVREVSGQKPVVAFADGMMCSAAYWIASQAREIIAAPLSLVGSIGVLMVHADWSAYLAKEGIKVTVLRATDSADKAKGNPYEPLDDDTKAALTRELDTANKAFHAVVRAGRAKISDEALTGAAWSVEDAPAGLVDKVGRIELAIERAMQLGRPAALTRAAKYMTDVIKAVRAAFSGKPFLTEALGMAADGKTEAEIYAAYSASLEAKNTSLQAEHAKQIDAMKAEHAKAISDKDAAHATALKAATDRADAAEAKLASGGFSAAEKGSKSGSSTRYAGITLRKI